MLAGLATPVASEEGPLARAVRSCQQDIEDHCDGVKMGQGRIWRCLLENDEKLSDECGAAIGEAALAFEEVSERRDEVIRACETDRSVYCPTAEWGQGGVVNCLLTQSHSIDSVSAGCRKMLEKHGIQ